VGQFSAPIALSVIKLLTGPGIDVAINVVVFSGVHFHVFDFICVPVFVQLSDDSKVQSQGTIL
jgi:hypothetical protein